MQLVHYAHAGHGSCIRPFLHTPEDRAKLPRLMRAAFELAWELGGSISGEHGCGLVRSGFLADQYGELYELMRQVKATFDPDGLLNPGKIVTDVGGDELAVSDLRYDAENKPELTQGALLHWEPGELEAEMEACNGCGVCRGMVKTQTMCPMFRALMTEESSPRAKANLMRHLVSGLLDESYRRRPELRRVADFCLNCKSCVLECPSGVNVPKLMNELKARYARDVGLEKVEKVLAGGEGMSRCSHFGPLATAATRLKPVRWIMEKLTSVDRRRPCRLSPGATGSRNSAATSGDWARSPSPSTAWCTSWTSWPVERPRPGTGGGGRAPPQQRRGRPARQLSAAMPPIDYGDLAAPPGHRRQHPHAPALRAAGATRSSSASRRRPVPDAGMAGDRSSDEARDWLGHAGVDGYLVALHKAGKLKTDFAPG